MNTLGMGACPGSLWRKRDEERKSRSATPQALRKCTILLGKGRNAAPISTLPGGMTPDLEER